ncbi:MAG: hypothetical protein WC975_05850 [Phycisphaerae bacterium]
MKPLKHFKTIIIAINIWILLCMGNCFAISVPELVQISNKSREHLKKLPAHIVFIEETKTIFSPRTIDAIKKSGSDVEAFKAAGQETKTHNELYLNLLTRDVKLTVKDLRDISSLLKTYNLPAWKEKAVSLDKIMLANGPYQLTLIESKNVNDKPQLLLEKSPTFSGQSPPLLYEHLMFLGILDERMLLSLKEPSISEEKLENINVLRIERIKSKDGHESKRIILCLPATGYRFKSIENRYDGHLVWEMLADDYRMVNGVPFPFAYTYKQYDYKENKLVSFRKYTVEKVEFNNTLGMDMMKIHVPKGTVLSDHALGGKQTEYSKDQDVGIKDIFNDRADKAATEIITDPNFCKEKKSVK